MVDELDSSGNVLSRYRRGAGIDEPLVRYQGRTTAYFQADGQGSITSLTDPAGGVPASYVYDSFGNLTASTGTVRNPFEYTGREFDSETGLYYYRARYYDLLSGRFLSEDPLALEGADINLYRFVRNSPTRFVDPLGLLAVSPDFNPDCLPSLQRALNIVREVARVNMPCNCAFKQIGSRRPLSDLVDDPSIIIKYYPRDTYVRENGQLTGIIGAHTAPGDTHSLFIRPYSCRMGRWLLAADLIHELVHISKGAVYWDDEELPRDMEILCGVTKPQMHFTR
jgi:RHS repeat-associated protein